MIQLLVLIAAVFVCALVVTFLIAALGCGDCGRKRGLCESCKSGPFGCNED